jgi:deoxycytidine triphosphate deaminase
MRLGKTILLTPIRRGEDGRSVDLEIEEGNRYMISPGEFVAALTEEILTLPTDICGRFGLKSSVTRKGLVCFGGIQIDPGFNGCLSISLFNVGPEDIELKLGETIFTVEFNRLEKATKKPYGSDPLKHQYQNQRDFPADQRDFILGAHTTSLAEIPLIWTDVEELGRRINLLEIIRGGDVVSFFTAKVAQMPEVRQVLISQEHGAIDVFTIINSDEAQREYEIYHLEQETLLSFTEAELDFHTINLIEYDKNSWSSLIPVGAKEVFRREDS